MTKGDFSCIWGEKVEAEIQKRIYQEQFKRDTEFTLYLLENGIIKELSKPELGCVVLYFDGDDLKYSGKLIKNDTDDKNKRVKGIWTNGDANIGIFEHSLWEVPSSYGKTVKYTSLPKLEDVDKHYPIFCEKYDLKYGINK